MIKKSISIGAVASLSLMAMFAMACQPAEEGINPALAAVALAGGDTAAETTTLSGTISADTTTSAKVVLSGAVQVASGVTLTFPAGAVIKGEPGSVLFVLAGGKINAVGTAAAPIVFTSASAVGSRKQQDWGGIVLIGKAENDTASTRSTEGPLGLSYGEGTDDADNSGTMQYVRIEFAGEDDGTNTGSEYNTLSLYTVGSGTTLDHIQAHMGFDDSYEFFGGSVNATNLLSTGTGDDAFDIDEGYIGTLDNIIADRYASATVSSDPNGMELDGSKTGKTADAGTTVRYSKPTIKNFTLLGQAAYVKSYGFRSRDSFGYTGGTADAFSTRHAVFENGLISGFSSGTCGFDGDSGEADFIDITNVQTDGATGCTNVNSGTGTQTLSAAIATFTGSAVASRYVEATPDVEPDYTSQVTGNGADAAEFTGWTYFRHN